MKKNLFSNVLTLSWNLLLVYLCYTLCRLIFLCVNWEMFNDHLTFGLWLKPARRRNYFRYNSYSLQQCLIPAAVSFSSPLERKYPVL